ncbi:hypothetical protein D3C81_2331730 [compost metagenome]
MSGAATATAFSITAIPKGSQASKDTLCATLSVNQAGKREVTGSAGTTGAAKCF